MMKKGMVIGLGIIFMVLFFINDAFAIPTFARKYRTSCTTCHVGYNKLNPFGQAYKTNGYNIPEGDAAYVKEEPVSLGAPAWKKVWPETVWPGMMPSVVPISMMVHQRTKWNEAHEEGTPQLDFDFPHEWELFVGGTLDEMISFFGEFVLYETGEGVAGAERLYFTFNDLFYGDTLNWLPENALNLKLGHFDIAADPLPRPQRRTLTSYLPTDTAVGSGAFKLRSRQSGFEAYGLLNQRFSYALGVVNGNGALGSDNNNHKDPYWRIDYKFGGMALDGSGGTESGELKQTNNWQEKSLILSTSGYYGRERLSSGTFDNKFRRQTISLQSRYKDLELLGAFVWGADDNPNNTGIKVHTNGWLLETGYVFYPWLIGTLRYEKFSYDDDTNDLSRFVPSLAIFVRANVRLIVEGILYPQTEDGNNQVLADLSISF